MFVWRITRERSRPLDGEEARSSGGRWSSKGVPVIYTSTSLALATLEFLMHADGLHRSDPQSGRADRPSIMSPSPCTASIHGDARLRSAGATILAEPYGFGDSGAFMIEDPDGLAIR